MRTIWVIWCSAILSTMNRICCYFKPFFCSFILMTTRKIKILKTQKRSGDIIISHVSWQIVLFLVILDHFFAFTPLTTQKIKTLKKLKNNLIYYHFMHVYHKWQSYDVWFLRYRAWRTNFFFYFGQFFALLSLKNMKNQNFEEKEMPGDIIILHKCNKIHDHMLFCSWYMARDRWNCYFSFWTIFCTFAP